MKLPVAPESSNTRTGVPLILLANSSTDPRICTAELIPLELAADRIPCGFPVDVSPGITADPAGFSLTTEDQEEGPSLVSGTDRKSVV